VVFHNEYTKDGIPINSSKGDPYFTLESDKHNTIDIEKEQISNKMKEPNPGADHYQNIMVMSFHFG
jgi:hypothetical protein